MLEKILQHCGLDDRVDKEDFPCNFFPVPDNYIIYQTGSEKKSQVYDYSSESLILIKDLLHQNNVTIIQVGDVDDIPVPSDLDLRGRLSIRQLAYVVKHSLLCVTSNRFSAKLCRVFKKNVILIGSNFPNKRIMSPFESLTYIEPEITNKWSYADEEVVKTINRIKPEVISQAILDKLNIFVNSVFSTVYIGEKYGPQVLDLIPDGPIPFNIGNQVINLRLDLLFEPYAAHLLSRQHKIFITTNKPLDLNILNKDNIMSIHYFCDGNVDLQFIKDCKVKNISIVVISSDPDKTNDLRLELLGITEVYKKIIQKPLDFSSFCDTLFKSSRLYISQGHVYPSLFHLKNKIQEPLVGAKILPEMMEDQDFLESKESMYIFKV
jgi:hypothetical protein